LNKPQASIRNLLLETIDHPDFTLKFRKYIVQTQIPFVSQNYPESVFSLHNTEQILTGIELSRTESILD